MTPFCGGPGFYDAAYLSADAGSFLARRDLLFADGVVEWLQGIGG